MPLPAMACEVCGLPLDSGKSTTVPLRCFHTFHEICLEASCKTQEVHGIQTMRCPTCKMTDSEVAEKQAQTQNLGAGDAGTPSVPENWRSQSSQDDHGAAPQAAAPTQVADPVEPGVASDMDSERKRFKWKDSQGVEVERNVPGSRSPQRVSPKELEAPGTPAKSQPLASQLTEDSQREGDESPGVSDNDFKFSFKDATRRRSHRNVEISDPVVAALEKINAASSQRELDKAVHSLALFEGF